ncbi:hypothetical protein [Sanguibacter antarcticus]|uniref:Uncharacterized protein n=1 Tax=Sanguibacter antarcticus TaxID=372484 RepID=A0A2A9E3P0_9MICO|nr:hypothetical protein [Sanguibacter antarcticus]PFG33568.1 hypothetical protein ATL42_1445 [Sanguibacter antarcticus]
MVQMYVWLVVAVVLAVGVVLLAATTSDEGEPGQEPVSAPRKLAATARQTWFDFLSGAQMLRARLDRLRVASSGSEAASGADGSRALHTGASPRLSVLAGASDRKDNTRPRTTDAWSFETPQDTTIDDFFAATQTSAPAYLDATQMSNALHRRR